MTATLFLATSAATNAATSVAAEPIARLSVGLKGSVGANYLAIPRDQENYDVEPFIDGAGGVGGGGGAVIEVRFLKQHLGLEVDLLADANRILCNVSYNDTIAFDYILKYTTLRIPLLLKAGFSKHTTRVSLGIGPEFIVGLTAKTDQQVTDGEQFVTDNEWSRYRAALKRNDVALAWELAFAFAVRKVDIALDFRFASHLSYPKIQDERAHSNNDFLVDMEAGHTIDMRILLGAAYNFAFGPKK
jgi:hypothetical protein